MSNNKTKSVGLIIKDRSLSAVELEIGKNGPNVTNYSKILLEEGIVENGCIIINKDSFQEAIKKLLSNGIGGSIKTNNLLVSIPEEKVFSHQLVIPKDRLNDRDFIKGAAKDFIPIELNKAIFDYKIIHEDYDRKTVTLSFVAVQNSIADPIIKALKEIKIDVIAMNVDINCLIRSFHNSLNQSEGDFLLLNLDLDRDLLAINSAKDGISKIIHKGEGQEITEKIRALFNLSDTVAVRELLIKAKQEDGINDEQKTNLRNSLKPYLDGLTTRIHQLISAAEAQESIDLRVIYLTGILSGLPGIEEILSTLLPEIPVSKGVKYTEIPAEIETDALEGIGLCLNETLPEDKNCFNLLPEQKKDEINLSKIGPKLKVLSAIFASLLMIFGFQMSLVTAKNYLKYKITSQEMAIYNDQALNPYITQVARIKQQTKQKDNQILTLLDSSLPVSLLIQDLNTYNNDEVTMISINYSEKTSLNAPDIAIKARTNDRPETEKFIESLKNNPIYSAIESPLSNLVGKGERFVSVGLMIDRNGLKETYDKKIDSPKPTPSSATPPKEDVTPNTEENNA